MGIHLFKMVNNCADNVNWQMKKGDNFNTGIIICSYNCRGFNFVKRDYIQKLLDECDILFIQEHWLSERRLVDLNVHPQFHMHGLCGFDNSEVLSGRPYGGCAIFWRASKFACVEIVSTNSRRVCAVRICCDTWRLLLINVYMPYEDGDSNTDVSAVELATIENIVNCNLDCHVIIGGNWNVDINRNWCHTALLESFSEHMSLMLADRHIGCSVDYTYNFNMQRFSCLDHFMLSGVLFDMSVLSVSVRHDGENISDHDPLVMSLNLEGGVFELTDRSFKQRIAWWKTNESNTHEYRQLLRQLLGTIKLPVDALTCHDPNCRNVGHSIALNAYAHALTDSCLQAAATVFPHTGQGVKRCLPGWNEYVKPEREQAILWHNIWVECGRPRDGWVASIMRRTRAKYHYAVRRVKRDRMNITRQRFVDAVLSDNSRDFWLEVKRMNGNKVGCANVVDDKTNVTSISDHFASYYKVLYNSVPYNHDEMENLYGWVY